jgi:hypothetical protein
VGIYDNVFKNRRVMDPLKVYEAESAHLGSRNLLYVYEEREG